MHAAYQQAWYMRHGYSNKDSAHGNVHGYSNNGYSNDVIVTICKWLQ